MMISRSIAVSAAGVCVLMLSVEGCQSVSPGPETRKIDGKSLTHASRELFIKDWTEADVRKQWGEPAEVRTDELLAPKYGQPKAIPAADRQWVYRETSKLSHRLIWFKDGNVVLAVEEWSDW